MTKLAFIILLLWIEDTLTVRTMAPPPITELFTRRPYNIRTRTTQDPLVDPRDRWFLNPNYGHEPYWANGAWILRDPMSLLGPNETTSKIPLVCGEECDYIYFNIKHVCGHQANEYSMPGCGIWWWRSNECDGEGIRNLTTKYKTFNTYCEFLNAQCKDKFWKTWVFMYEGKCNHNQDTYLKPIAYESSLVTRANDYIHNFQKEHNVAPKTTMNPRPTRRPRS